MRSASLCEEGRKFLGLKQTEWRGFYYVDLKVDCFDVVKWVIEKYGLWKSVFFWKSGWLPVVIDIHLSDSDRDYGMWMLELSCLLWDGNCLTQEWISILFDWKMLMWNFDNRRLGWHVSEILPILSSLSALFLDVSIIYAGVLILTTKFCLTIGNCVCVCVCVCWDTLIDAIICVVLFSQYYKVFLWVVLWVMTPSQI